VCRGPPCLKWILGRLRLRVKLDTSCIRNVRYFSILIFPSTKPRLGGLETPQTERKKSGMLIFSLRGVDQGFWSLLIQTSNKHPRPFHMGAPSLQPHPPPPHPPPPPPPHSLMTCSWIEVMKNSHPQATKVASPYGHIRLSDSPKPGMCFIEVTNGIEFKCIF